MKISKWAILAFVFIVGTMSFYVLNKNKNSMQKLSLKKGSITEAIYGLGTVISDKNFSFKVGTTKTVQGLFVKEGDIVQKGQKLIDLSEGLSVKAPFTGTVITLPYNLGENVFSNLPIVEMQDLKDLYVSASLDQQGALRVKKNLPVMLSFENVRNQTFKGIVESLFPKGGQFIARIRVQDLPAEILPGMTADVAIEVAKKDNVLLVPVKALQSGQVTMIKNNDKVKVQLKIGIMDEEWAEVLEGDIQENDQVLISR